MIYFLLSQIAGPLSVDRYAEIDDEVDVEQCSDSESMRNTRNTRKTGQTSLASPSCASDEERLTPEQISVSEEERRRKSEEKTNTNPCSS